MKKQFLNNELWTLTVGAAFQRSYLYKKNVSDNEKRDFKDNTRKFIDSKILPHYKSGEITEAQHLKNIHELSSFTKKFSSIFQNGKMNFGVSQKMLNLHLKYQWCKGDIKEPPHFPVDRIIQEELNKVARKNKLKTKKIEPWTQFEDEEKYMETINSHNMKTV